MTESPSALNAGLPSSIPLKVILAKFEPLQSEVNISLPLRVLPANARDCPSGEKLGLPALATGDGNSRTLPCARSRYRIERLLSRTSVTASIPGNEEPPNIRISRVWRIRGWATAASGVSAVAIRDTMKKPIERGVCIGVVDVVTGRL
jgi:hypothetical protein